MCACALLLKRAKNLSISCLDAIYLKKQQQQRIKLSVMKWICFWFPFVFHRAKFFLFYNVIIIVFITKQHNFIIADTHTFKKLLKWTMKRGNLRGLFHTYAINLFYYLDRLTVRSLARFMEINKNGSLVHAHQPKLSISRMTFDFIRVSILEREKQI